jgi:triosephosphate isomerase (TIM)
MNRTLVAGNWKMNGLRADLATVKQVAQGLTGDTSCVEALLCVPATLLSAAAEAASGSSLQVGAQCCHPEAKGAFTGDISAAMIGDAGGRYVIVGHSERRTHRGETDMFVAGQAKSAQLAGLIPIICVGESAAERASASTLDVVAAQLRGSAGQMDMSSAWVLAYEPLWAIGTGQVATNAQIAEVHAFIRSWLIGRHEARGERIQILYGGSLNPANAAEILAIPDVNGGLIGGASLKAADFLAIYAAALAHQE